MIEGIKYSDWTKGDLREEYICLPWFIYSDDGETINDAEARKAIATDLKAQGKRLKGHSIFTKRGTNGRLKKSELRGHVNARTHGWESLIDEWDVLTEVQGFMRRVPDWEVEACSLVREVCPDAKIWLNEYAIQNPDYWNAVFQQASSLKGQGLIDGIGVQLHIDLRGPWAFLPGTHKAESSNKPRLPEFARSLQAKLHTAVKKERLEYEAERFMKAGLLVQVSELSVVGFADEAQKCEDLEAEYVEIARSMGLHSYINWGKRLRVYEKAR